MLLLPLWAVRPVQSLSACTPLFTVISHMKYVLYFYIRNFRSMCAVPSRHMVVFCSSLISCSPSMLLRYCLSDLEMVLVAPVITGVTSAFTFHLHWISIIRSSYFRIFSDFSWSHFCLHKLQQYTHSFLSLSRFMMSGLLLGLVLSARTCWFHNIVTLPSRLVSTDFRTWSQRVCCLILPLLPSIR